MRVVYCANAKRSRENCCLQCFLLASNLTIVFLFQVCLLCARVGGCSAGTLAALLAIAASVVQVHRYQSKSAADNSAARNARAGTAVSPVGGGSDAGQRESACRLSRKDESLPRKDELLSQKDGFLSQKDGSSKVHTDGSSHAEQQGAMSTGVLPPPMALTNRGDAFEGAITRLAGAAELGTESRIYVRRVDVAEIIDALMDHARVSAGSGAASPALARLSIMRRSRRREGRGKRRDGRGRRLACSPEGGVIERVRAPPIDHSRSSPSPASSFFGTANDPERALLKEGFAAAAAVAVCDGTSGTLNAHSLSQACMVKVDDGATTVRRARGGGRGGEQRRWRSRTRSPPPPASLTPVARIQKAPSPSTPASTAEVLRTEIKSGPSSACGSTSEKITRVPIRPVAACGTTSAKITRVPIRPAAAGKGADFEDFWSSGWG